MGVRGWETPINVGYPQLAESIILHQDLSVSTRGEAFWDLGYWG